MTALIHVLTTFTSSHPCIYKLHIYNIEVVSRCFENDWGSFLLDASKKLQDLLMRETGNVRRGLTEEISEIKRFIKDRYGEVTLDEMVRRISVICNK